MDDAYPPTALMRWEIVCKVVDNFGDIGIGWRLARQLAGPWRQAVRLWVDDLQSFARLYAAVDVRAKEQYHNGIHICQWNSTDFSTDWEDIGDVVVEAFGCGLPGALQDAMAARVPSPRWIQLEYLSAEDWVVSCHGLTSPQPRRALSASFFFPGFVAGTGGLLCEPHLFAQRDAFQSNRAMQDAFWRRYHIAPRGRMVERRVLLFSYANPALPSLLDAWSRSATPVRCLVAPGEAVKVVTDWLTDATWRVGEPRTRGALTVHRLPWLEQAEFDQLLWACDVNFVRGEDSLVRALWAARPLIWQLYPQAEYAHWQKYRAFAEMYTQSATVPAATAWRALNEQWNGVSEMGDGWGRLDAQLGACTRHALQVAQRLRGVGEMAEELLKFSQLPVSSC